ncbi:MAG TPA: DUF4132 domain-containing protein [Anaeromyxobacteraceae bacterium]|nr:DUF4132 domain-containing protein [Anaeromyxobacteraceae bacterium]
MAESKAARKRKPEAAPDAPAGLEEAGGWIDAGDGYSLTLEGGKLACRNSAGRRLASVPKVVQASETGQRLLTLRDWLQEHDRSCAATVEGWMLRSLPAPRAVIQAVFVDPSWRAPLENAVVVPIDDRGALRSEQAGLLKAVDPARGLGVVDLDGETRWLTAERFGVPHPILLPALEDLRELAGQLGVHQGIAQLFRETFARTAAHAEGATRLDEFSDGKFAQLMHALSKSRQLGYPVRGGFACCPVFERGRRVEARYWIGAEAPEAETWTGDLCFVDAREQALELGKVGPVAFSEGVRMAKAIFGARVVEKEEP